MRYAGIDVGAQTHFVAIVGPDGERVRAALFDKESASPPRAVDRVRDDTSEVCWASDARHLYIGEQRLAFPAGVEIEELESQSRLVE